MRPARSTQRGALAEGRTKPVAADPSMPVRDGAAGGPRAMGRMLRLFDLLARRRERMTLSELSFALEVPKSTLLSSLRGLVAEGHLMNEGNHYMLGPSIFRLAGTIMSAWSMPDIIRHYLRELARATNESVGFAIADWEIGQAIYTDATNSPQPVHYAMRAGIRAPLYASAAGRVLLAFAPAERRDAYLARGPFKALTATTRTTADSIRGSLETIARQGYCASFGEMLKDTAALAVPTFDAEGKAIGALMLATPLNRMERNYEQLIRDVTRYGRLASGLPTIAPAEDGADLADVGARPAGR